MNIEITLRCIYLSPYSQSCGGCGYGGTDRGMPFSTISFLKSFPIGTLLKTLCKMAKKHCGVLITHTRFSHHASDMLYKYFVQ